MSLHVHLGPNISEDLPNEKTSSNLDSKKIKIRNKSGSKYNGTYCCVGNCNARTGREPLQLFNVIRKRPTGYGNFTCNISKRGVNNR